MSHFHLDISSYLCKIEIFAGGIFMEKKARNKSKTTDPSENALYHDTWKLLKNYRDVVWSHIRLKTLSTFLNVDRNMRMIW